MKSKVTINVESFLLEEAKQNHINISQTTEDGLRSKLAVIKGDASNINKRLLLVQIEKEEKNVNKHTQTLIELRNQMSKIEGIENKAEEHRLNKEKTEIEAQTKCINCGNLILDKFQQFPKGKVCHACFMSNDEGVSKWR